MKIAMTPVLNVLFLATLPAFVHGHGYMFEPSARNYLAHTNGIEGVSTSGVPQPEYCPHCLNSNSGVCGISENGANFDNWLDSQGNQMPWITQQSYTKGQIITVRSHLASNHAGHMELRGCPHGRASEQECFDQHVFEFVEDVTYEMPADSNYSERGYYWGGQQANGIDFTMKFRIPISLVGDQVMLQWRYITANSCSPPGYNAYFSGKDLPDQFWSPLVPDCVPPYPLDLSRSYVWPEQFVNCAEVSIGGDAEPTISTTPTKAPTGPLLTNQLTSGDFSSGDNNDGCCSQDFKACISWCGESKEACENCSDSLMTWLVNGPDTGSTCLVRWETCTDNKDECCNGLICVGDQYYMQCQHPDEGGIIIDPVSPVSTFDTDMLSPTQASSGDCGTEWCSTGFTGLKAWNACTQYYHCVDGIVTGSLVDVPPGTLFDENLQNVSWRQNIFDTCVVSSCDNGTRKLKGIQI